MTLAEGDALKWARILSVDGKKDVLIATKLGFASRIPADNITVTGRTSRGVRALKLRQGDQMADIDLIPVDAGVGTATGTGTSRSPTYVVAVTERGYGKRIPIDEFSAQRRGGKGVIAIKFKKGECVSELS